MTKGRLSRREALRLAALAPVAVAVSRVPGALAATIDKTPTEEPCGPPPMGMVGIAAGQKAAIGLFHHEQIPCDVVLRFVGIDGKSLVEEKVTVPGGGGVHREYDLAAGLGKTPGQADRLMFHVEIVAPVDHPLGSSVEIFDEKTGRLVGAVAPCDRPTPPLPMGMIGVANGETLRVGLFHHETIPCSGLVEIIGVEGKPLTAKSIQLQPGGGGFVDFPIGLDVAKGERLPVHIDVHHPANHEVSASFELFDPKTGAGFQGGCNTPDRIVAPSD